VLLAVNSRGGCVFAAEAIYNAVKRHKGRVTARVDAMAASAASYVLCAAAEVVMSPGSHIMVHSPLAVQVTANQHQLREVIERLEQIEEQYRAVYRQRTGQDEATIREWMRQERWFSAAEAVRVGFADRVDVQLPAAAWLPAGTSLEGLPRSLAALAGRSRPDLRKQRHAQRLRLAAVVQDALRRERKEKRRQMIAELDRRQRQAGREARVSEYYADWYRIPRGQRP
jgi:Clp protease